MKHKKPTLCKGKKPKSRITKVDLDAVLKLQKDYDELKYEVKTFMEAIYNMQLGRKYDIIEFNNEILCNSYRLIYDHATWNKDKDQ